MRTWTLNIFFKKFVKISHYNWYFNYSTLLGLYIVIYIVIYKYPCSQGISNKMHNMKNSHDGGGLFSCITDIQTSKNLILVFEEKEENGLFFYCQYTNTSRLAFFTLNGPRKHLLWAKTISCMIIIESFSLDSHILLKDNHCSWKFISTDRKQKVSGSSVFF